MRALVRQWTGIPTCVGIAPTKTLAKLANAVAKKDPALGQVCDLMRPAVRDAVLRAFEVGDVWGIGRAATAKLAALGVTTAAGLRDLDAKQARLLGTVVLERTVLELRGLPCIALEEAEPQRKGLACTRSFGLVVVDQHELLEAMASHAARAGEKLRGRGMVAGKLTAFFHTSPLQTQHTLSSAQADHIMDLDQPVSVVCGCVHRVADHIMDQ